MGNQVQGMDEGDKDLKGAISNINYMKRRNQSIITSEHTGFDSRTQTKWKEGLLDALRKEAARRKRSKKDQICSDLDDIIKNLREDLFVKTVSIFHSMASNPLEQSATKGILKQSFVAKIVEEHKSERVKIEIDTDFWKGDGFDSASTSSIHSNGGSFSKSNNSNTNAAVKKTLQKTLVKEINQQYHPIKHIKDSFIMMLKMKYRSKLDEKPPKTKAYRQQILQQIQDDIDFYCSFVAEGCGLYKTWIMQQAGIKQNRYIQFTKRIVREGLFTGVSISQQMFPIIKQICSKQVQILIRKLPSQVDISIFQIKDQLSIDGAFLNSLMTLSDFDRIQSPNVCMQKLQIIKTQICYDIDQYHKMFGHQKTHKIDGDNLLSIIGFLLCRMKPKVIEIYTQLHMLNSIFGDDAQAIFDEASYMLTSFIASFEFLTSSEFINKL